MRHSNIGILTEGTERKFQTFNSVRMSKGCVGDVESGKDVVFSVWSEMEQKQESGYFFWWWGVGYLLK